MLQQPREPTASTPRPGRIRQAVWAERSELTELHGKQVFVNMDAPLPRLLILGAGGPRGGAVQARPGGGLAPVPMFFWRPPHIPATGFPRPRRSSTRHPGRGVRAPRFTAPPTSQSPGTTRSSNQQAESSFRSRSAPMQRVPSVRWAAVPGAERRREQAKGHGPGGARPGRRPIRARPRRDLPRRRRRSRSARRGCGTIDRRPPGRPALTAEGGPRVHRDRGLIASVRFGAREVPQVDSAHRGYSWP